MKEKYILGLKRIPLTLILTSKFAFMTKFLLILLIGIISEQRKKAKISNPLITIYINLISFSIKVMSSPNIQILN